MYPKNRKNLSAFKLIFLFKWANNPKVVCFFCYTVILVKLNIYLYTSKIHHILTAHEFFFFFLNFSEFNKSAFCVIVIPMFNFAVAYSDYFNVLGFDLGFCWLMSDFYFFWVFLNFGSIWCAVTSCVYDSLTSTSHAIAKILGAFLWSINQCETMLDIARPHTTNRTQHFFRQQALISTQSNIFGSNWQVGFKAKSSIMQVNSNMFW